MREGKKGRYKEEERHKIRMRGSGRLHSTICHWLKFINWLVPVQRYVLFHLWFRHMQPLLWVVFGTHVCHKIKGSQSGLTTWGNKDQYWFIRWVSLYGGVGWLVHSGHAGAVMFPGKPLDVNLQLYGPHSRMEVEQPSLVMVCVCVCVCVCVIYWYNANYCNN